jgi:hypothetical protein
MMQKGNVVRRKPDPEHTLKGIIAESIRDRRNRDTSARLRRRSIATPPRPAEVLGIIAIAVALFVIVHPVGGGIAHFTDSGVGGHRQRASSPEHRA